jgi:hypothetical protein
VETLGRDYAALLLAEHQPPCVSLYQPTHRHFPERQQDQIRFRNLVRSAEASLRDNYAVRDPRSFMAPFQALAEDETFWGRTLSGLAVLASATTFQIYRLQRSVPERLVVADSFHTKPLLRILQSADRYHILGLSRAEARLFEGNRDEIEEIEPKAGVPRLLDEVVGSGPERRSRVYGRAGAGATTQHGTDLREDEQAGETERFFRTVDRTILEQHSRPSGMPLVLAALPEHHHLFRAISRNPFLLAEAIGASPNALSLDELRERAWAIVLPYYLDRLAKLIARFAEARGTGLGTDDLAQTAAAAAAGRIEALLIDAERHVPGTFDPATGAIEREDVGGAVDDLLDDIGERALRTASEVVVVPSERMPSATGVAAIFRY